MKLLHPSLALGVALAALGLSACSGSSSGGETVVVAGTPSSNVSGRVVDGNGGPLEGIRVDVNTTPGTFVFSDADGWFNLDLDSGDYLLSAGWQNGIAANLPLTVDEQDQVLDAWQIVTTVVGQVVNGGGSPVTGASIEVTGDFEEQQFTDADGRFEMQLPTGQYFLVGSIEDYDFQTFGFGIDGLEPTSLGTLQALTLLSGRFLDGYSAPLSGVLVNVFSTPDAFAITGDDGRFEVQVPTGNHSWTATLGGMLLADEVVSVPDVQPIDLGSQQLLVELAGRVVDESLAPVQGAEAVADTSPLTIQETDADGRFQLSLPLGQIQFSVRINGVVVAQRLVNTEALVGQGIVSMSEIVTSFAGDSDLDGLSDEFELAGWTILVDSSGDGQLEVRKVSSNPFNANSDNDTLTDDQEFAFKTDPSQADTDGDLLDDEVELFQYLSQPARADTDGDAMGNGLPSAQFLDGFEILFLGTSPTLADTDGDGVDDRSELEEGGTSPLVANLPEIAIEVFGEPVVGFVGTEVETGETATLQTTVQNDETASNSSNEFNLKMNSSLDTMVKAEASYGWPGGWSGSVEAEATLKAGVNTDYTYHTTNDSASSLAATAESSTDTTSGFEYTGGKIEAAIEVKNLTDITLRYDELEILVFQIDPSAGASGLKPLGALDFEGGVFEGSDGVLLGPQGSNTLFAKNEGLDLGRVRDYMSNPTGLYFRIGNFDLLQLDESGGTVVDYDLVAQNVAERTATLAIDYGDGNVQRYAIATNIEREPDGTPLGIRMADALDLLDLEFATDVVGPGGGGVTPDPLPITWQKQVLTQLEGFATETVEDENAVGGQAATRYWVTLGPGVVDEFAGESVDFPDIRLKPGEAYLLQYVLDEDADGLTSLQERLYGTSDVEADSDGDGASDFEEVEGWEVSFDPDLAEECGLDSVQLAILGFDVRSNPRFPDTDGDGKPDGAELDDLTNPLDPDTDDDGTDDLFDGPNNPCTFNPGLAVGPVVRFDFSDANYSFDVDLEEPVILSDGIFPLKGRLLFNSEGIVDELPDKESGLEWTSGLQGDSASALWFRRDHPYFESSYSVGLGFNQSGDLVDVTGDRARVEVPLDSPAMGTLPPLAAAHGSGFTIATWTRLDAGWVNVGFPPIFVDNQVTLELKPWTAGQWLNTETQHLLDIHDFVSLQVVNQPNNVGFYATVYSTLPDGQRIQHQLAADNGLDENWHQVVFTVGHDGGAPGSTFLNLYIDGTLEKNQNIEGTVFPPKPIGSSDANPLRIGHREGAPGTSSSFFNADFFGRMDDLRIYDVALDQAQVQALFDEGP